MADDEQAEGAEIAAAPKSKLKVMIAAVGGFVIVCAAATWFLFFKGHGEEVHAEAPAPKQPVYIVVPEMRVNLAGQPGERVLYV
jgi:flagellar FliL protein